MAKIIITKRYDHRWPSRAVTCFLPRELPYVVKREVATAAVEGGYGFEPESDTDADTAREDQPAGQLDGRDSRPVDDNAGPSADRDLHRAGADDGADQPPAE